MPLLGPVSSLPDAIKVIMILSWLMCISVLEERCDEAQKKILCLEQENGTIKEENVELQRQNARSINNYRKRVLGA